MAATDNITPDLCRQLLRYEPETGRLFWRERPRELCESDRIHRSWNTKWAGRQAFLSLRANPANDYACYIGAILNVKCKAHRVAWAIFHGEWPDEIDHINGDPLDNRIVNLRSVSHRENAANRRTPTNNKSGHMGVQWAERHGKWLAVIKVPGKTGNRHIGLFDNVEDAAQARREAQQALGYHANHGR